MFGLFKKKSNTDDSEQIKTPEVLGLRVGGSFEINDLKFKIIQDQFTFEGASKLQIIEAVGVVELDQTTTILRFYTDDEGFIQVICENGVGDENVVDVKLWYYYETIAISGENAWHDTLRNHVSQEEFMVNEHNFQRTWNDLNNDSPPVAMTETTISYDQGNRKHSFSKTDQFVMLYERSIDDSLLEYLLVSGEEQIVDDAPQRCLVSSTGMDLSAADFNIVS